MIFKLMISYVQMHFNHIVFSTLFHILVFDTVFYIFSLVLFSPFSSRELDFIAI